MPYISLLLWLNVGTNISLCYAVMQLSCTCTLTFRLVVDGSAGCMAKYNVSL